MNINVDNENNLFKEYRKSRGACEAEIRAEIEERRLEYEKKMRSIKQQKELYKMKLDAIYAMSKNANEKPKVNVYA